MEIRCKQLGKGAAKTTLNRLSQTFTFGSFAFFFRGRSKPKIYMKKYERNLLATKYVYGIVRIYSTNVLKSKMRERILFTVIVFALTITLPTQPHHIIIVIISSTVSLTWKWIGFSLRTVRRVFLKIFPPHFCSSPAHCLFALNPCSCAFGFSMKTEKNAVWQKILEITKNIPYENSEKCFGI